MRNSRRWLVALGLAAAIVLVGAAWRAGKGSYQFRGITTDLPPAAEFDLAGQGDGRVRLSDYRGKLVLLYFGYTYCPGICPTTLADVDQALKMLEPRKAARVQFLMVSVDPERDTAQRLREYMAHFNPTFIGLTGTLREVAAAASRYGIYYKKGETAPAGGYVVDHTSMVIVVDPAGRVRLLFPFGTPVEAMASDLAYLLR